MDSVQRMYNRLEAGAADFQCSGVLAGFEPLVRTQVYTQLLYERLQRKNTLIEHVYRNEGFFWEQVFFTLMMRFLGAPSNTENFAKLARTVSYRIVRKFTDVQSSLEALLIGASGLLELYPDDDYTSKLKAEFDYMSRKYQITPMEAAEWNTERIYPHNHPVLRLAQAAAIMSSPSFHIRTALACRTGKDVDALFSHEASDYWTTHFIPSVPSAERVKRIGKAKADILAINALVPLQFSYGSFTEKDSLRDAALELLDHTQPEHNFKVRRWTDGGVIPKSAFDTQALIQLGDEYCCKGRCRECPVGGIIIKRLRDACKLEENK